jgi:hypothetical protein
MPTTLLGDLMTRNDGTPSTLDMFRAMGGTDDEMVELLLHALATVRAMPDKLAMDDMVAVLGAGALIGYYYALESLARHAVGGKSPC